VSVGYFAGQHITTIYNAITRYSLYAAIAAVVLIAAWVVHRIRKHRRTLADAATGAAAKRDTAAQPQSATQPEAAAEHEAATQPEATAGKQAAVRPEATAEHEAATQPEATAAKQAAAGQASGVDHGRDGPAERDGLGDRPGVAAGEDGSGDWVARRGQGLTGPQDSERS
jgi:cytoskeletal protein RodZ